MSYLPVQPYWGSGSGSGGGDPRISERIVPSGMIFRYPDGTPHRIKRSSDFPFGDRLTIRGEDMEPIAADRKAIGANSLRLFCQYDAAGIGKPFGRSLTAAMYTPQLILDTARWLQARNLRVEFTILADCDQLGMNHAAQVQRVGAVLEVVSAEPNVVVELGNEPGKNGCDVDLIAKDLGLTDPAKRKVPICTGNYDWTNNATIILDFFNNHLERKQTWPGEAGKEGHFLYGGWDASANGPAWKGCKPAPVVSDEPIGCTDDPGTPNYGRRDNRPDAFEDGGAGWGVGCAGADFHSDRGVQSVLFGDVSRECGRRMFAAIDFFPADAPTGTYTHDGLSDHPLASTAGKTSDEVVAYLHGTRAYAVAALPTASYAPVAVNGWRIAAEYGSRRNILWLER